MARSLQWTKGNFLRPVTPLSPTWLSSSDDGSSEYRLAASLASVYGKYGDVTLPLRTQLEPVRTWIAQGKLQVTWDELAIVDVTWHEGDVIDAMNAVMGRRLLLATREGTHSWPDTGRAYASLGDITAFIEGRIDFARFARLSRGLCLVDWPQVSYESSAIAKSDDGSFPGATFALMKLCHAGTSVREAVIPLAPDIHQRAAAGNGASATQLASRRLRASGLPTAVEQTHHRGDAVRRGAAALLFPICRSDLHALADAVLRSKTPKT
jgi:CRISPR-associated protein Csx17